MSYKVAVGTNQRFAFAFRRTVLMLDLLAD